MRFARATACLAMASLSAVLAGCMSVGTEVDPGKVSAFERGRTTYADVVGQLGTPNADVIADDGTRAVVYSYTRAQARPASFIPIVGPLVGGADATTTGYTFKFDRNGVLTGSGRTNAQASTGSLIGGSSTTATMSAYPVPMTSEQSSAQASPSPAEPEHQFQTFD